MLALPFTVLCLVHAPVVTALVVKKCASVDYFDPALAGGSMLDNATYGGEPLNVIISGLSSPEVLTGDGILNWAKAIGFSQECFGFHRGAPQTANLGDGNGWRNQTTEIRQDFGHSIFGSCLESLIGGNHFRYDASQNHDLVVDGYNIGRDELVAAAVGTKSHGGATYNTVAKNIAGLMAAGSEGVNRGIAVDGIVTLLTVTVQ